MRSILVALVAVLVPLLLAACSANTSPGAMTVMPYGQAAPNPRLAGAVAIGAVSGGQETNPLWTSQVDDGSFRQALTDSLRANGYLAAARDGAPYALDAQLLSLDQPFIGFEFDVTSSVNYTLRGPGTERSYPVTAVGTGHMSDSVAAVIRLKVANERSIKANIEKLLNELQGF